MNLNDKINQTDVIKSELFVHMLNNTGYQIMNPMRVVFFSDSTRMHFCIGQGRMSWDASYDEAVRLHGLSV